jgi:F-type H+-transporting ATPase subunit delta
MAGAGAARRYAKALFQLAEETGAVAEVRGQVDALSTLLAEHGELGDVLLRPLYPVAQRRAVMAAVAERLGAGPLLRSFLSYLIDRRRLLDFAAIRAEYGRLADERAGITRATVRAASGSRRAARAPAARASRRGSGARCSSPSVDPACSGA